MKNYREILKQITLLSQLGLSILMPLLICLGICAYLTNKVGVGGWVFIPGFIMGFGSSFMTAYKFYMAVIKKESKEKDKKEKVYFNKHF